MRLGDIARESRETFKGDKTDVPIVGLEHLISQELRFTDYEVNTDNTFTKSFRKGQILFGRRRAYLKKAAIAEIDGVCSGDITVIEAIPGKVDSQLLPFIIQNDRLFDFAVSRSAGGLSPRVKWEHLADYELELPSIEEQRVLADKLWAAYELKEAYKKMIAATDEMVKSQFIEMFGDINDNSNGIPFDEIFYDDTKSATKISASEYLSSGQYAIYDQSQDTQICGYSNDDDGVNMDYPVILFGDHSRVVKLIDRPFYIGADGVKIIRSKQFDLNIVFAYYMIKYCYIPETGYNRHFKYLKLKRFFAPDREKQNQFVAIAQQADKSKFELRQAIDKIDKVMKSLLQ